MAAHQTVDSPLRAARQKENLPRHIAVIMDGNNRWSKERNEDGLAGHRAGAVAARALVNHCGRRNIEYLTLFAFSSENWRRPQKEVRGLMALFLDILKRSEVDKLHRNNMKLRFIGNRGRFSRQLRSLMQAAERLTRHNTGLTVVIAADYGGQWDVANAAKMIAGKVAAGELEPEAINESTMQDHIAIGELPPPDLCIRTGGEQRISNFLLWQFAYTEFYFTDTYWPDFDEAKLDAALQDFAGRQRRYGKVSRQLEAEQAC